MDREYEIKNNNLKMREFVNKNGLKRQVLALVARINTTKISDSCDNNDIKQKSNLEYCPYIIFNCVNSKGEEDYNRRFVVSRPVESVSESYYFIDNVLATIFDKNTAQVKNNYYSFLKKPVVLQYDDTYSVVNVVTFEKFKQDVEERKKMEESQIHFFD